MKEKEEEKVECEYAAVSYPHEETPVVAGGAGLPCGNTWTYKDIQGWGEELRDARNDLFTKARRQSENFKTLSACGARDCIREHGECIYRAELTPTTPQRIPFYDLEAPEGTPPRYEYLLRGKLRYGCFCDNSI